MSSTTQLPIENIQSVSAMQLRRQSGDLLNRVFYKKEKFVVERSGEPMAVVIPVAEYKSQEIKKKRARKRLAQMVDDMRSSVSHLDDEEIQKIVANEVEAVKAEYRSNNT